MDKIKPGLYEAIITQRLVDALKSSGLDHDRAKLGKEDAPALLSQFLGAARQSARRGQAVPTLSLNQNRTY